MVQGRLKQNDLWWQHEATETGCWNKEKRCCRQWPRISLQWDWNPEQQLQIGDSLKSDHSFPSKNNDPSFPLSKVSFLGLCVFLYTWYGYATPWMTRTIEDIILGLVFLEDYCIPGVKSLKIVTFCDTCCSGGTKWKLRETHRRCQWWIVWKSPGKKTYPFMKMVLSRP